MLKLFLCFILITLVVEKPISQSHPVENGGRHFKEIQAQKGYTSFILYKMNKVIF